MGIEFLDEYDGILPNLPRSYGRVCCICERDKTYSYDGTPVWAKYKDENGKWTGEWTCHNCQGKRKGYKFKKLKKCRLCGSDKIVQSNGKKIRDLDIKKKWTGYYLCYECAYKNNRPSCGHINRIRKIYKNGMWTGEYLCDICDDS